MQARRSFSQNRLFRFWHDFGTNKYVKKLKKSIKKCSKKQSQNESEFEARNGAKMAPKMSPGTPQGATKNETKNEAKKSLEKRACRCSRGHAGFATELSREAGFPPNPAGSDPAGALKTL